jgi:hypothetical protein
MLERSLKEAAVGQLLTPEVSQSTISRWIHGDVPTEDQFNQLIHLFFAPWYYVCSFSEQYAPSLALDAREALFRVRAKAPVTGRAPLVCPTSIEVDLHIRPGKLADGAWAHTFANHSEPALASVFVILVRDDLTYERQYRIAGEELLAHVFQPKTKSDRGLPVAVSLRQHHRNQN